MLQQNSYFAKRYAKWVIASYMPTTYFSAVSAAVAALFLVLKFDIVLLILSAVSLIRIKMQISLQKKSIKPLVFTARIKRMYFTLALVFAVLLLLGIILKSDIPVIILYALSFVSVLSGFLVKVLNHIPEKLIANGYINSAKRILKSLDRLSVVGVTGSYGKTGTKFILGTYIE